MTSVSRSIVRSSLPPSALLNKYAGDGGYADCYVTEIAAAALLPEYVEAFYTTSVFKLERLILSLAVAKPSSDADARRLAQGHSDSFAAWSVEARAMNQLLMCDFQNRTRSWLMVEPLAAGAGTRLYFGSGIVPIRGRSGANKLSFFFDALLDFHKMYSRILLRAARSRLESSLLAP